MSIKGKHEKRFILHHLYITALEKDCVAMLGG